MAGSMQSLFKVLEFLLKENFLLLKSNDGKVDLIYCKSIQWFVLSPENITQTVYEYCHYSCPSNSALTTVNWIYLPSTLLEKSKFPFLEMTYFLDYYGLSAKTKVFGQTNRFWGSSGEMFKREGKSNSCIRTSAFSFSSYALGWPCFRLDEDLNSFVAWLRVFQKYQIRPSVLCDDFLTRNFAEHKGLAPWEMNQASKAFDEVMKLRDINDDFLKRKLLGESLQQNLKGKTERGEKMAPTYKDDFTKNLLECDKIRADIEPYDSKILTDPNRGHWELFSSSKKKNSEYIGRNPILDVKENGVVGIDFGTKSTVVVYQNEDDCIHPMRVGTGELKKEITKKDFENPTIIELASFKQFWDEYQDGYRPKTKWDDVKVSHQADLDFFNDTSKDNYSAYFSDLKKWAGAPVKNSVYNLRDKKKDVIALEPYSELKENDFDPIEVYAYYLGLYINNMRNGIYLEYYLSFPVSYERSVQKKITESFERGLKKSLPREVAENSGIMERFCVHGDVNEPAAYAVCALHEYGFTPEKGKKINYGIFDFGGGTTDFDFGEWSVSEKRKYDFKITHFGAQGDKYLGGENLLELLAYNVFKNNKDALLKEDISFVQPQGCKVFPGSEMLISTSSEAHYNMKNLMNVLRRFWENTESDDEKQEFDESGCLKVNLLKTDGSMVSSFSLEAKREDIMNTIRSCIESGVVQFFNAFDSAFFNNGDAETEIHRVYILLAGNSCKSPIVKELFEKHILEYETSAQKKDLFKLLPPIGSDAFMEARDSLKTEVSITDLSQERSSEEIPTGKTGVAYGLIMSRKGGRIDVENKNVVGDDIPFKYYLGYQSRGCFQLIEDGEQPMKLAGRIDIGTWYEFMEVEEGECVTEIYFSDIPEAVTNKMSVSKAQKCRCRYDEATEDGFLYVKANDPHTIEYAIAASKKQLEKTKKYTISLDG